MAWRDGFIAVDWGTTNRRAYALDQGGVCTGEFEDGKGILSVAEGGFPAAVAEIRERLGDRPLLLGGMIGSDRGWSPAPYAPCPAGLDEVSAAVVRVDGRAAIVPGVSFRSAERADVMRGEELQILGAVSQRMIPRDALVCHPGTHNKWIQVEDGRIAAFRTVMTGEVFNLLRGHSILAPLMKQGEGTGAPFQAGVRHGLECDDLLSELFAVRARVLIADAPADAAAPYVSGLLIGNDLRVGLRGKSARTIHVVGRPELTKLYAAALAHAGREPREIDGEAAFLAGAKAVAERL